MWHVKGKWYKEHTSKKRIDFSISTNDEELILVSVYVIRATVCKNINQQKWRLSKSQQQQNIFYGDNLNI